MQVDSGKFMYNQDNTGKYRKLGKIKVIEGKFRYNPVNSCNFKLILVYSGNFR